MAERRFSEVPCEQGDCIFSFFKVFAYVYCIVVAVAWGGAALQTAFEYNRAAVYPQPIFAVGCNVCNCFVGALGESETFAENLPCIRSVGAVGGAYPFCCSF